MEYEFIEKKRSRFLALPLFFTKYLIAGDKITIKTGLFTKVEDDAFMYKIQDVKLQSTLLERMLGLGTVVCYTGDITHPHLTLERIKNSREIKDFISDKSEEQRILKRTLHTTNIDGGPDLLDRDDIDGVDYE